MEFTRRSAKRRGKRAEQNICEMQNRLKRGVHIDQAMGNIDCLATKYKTKQHTSRIKLYETFATSISNLIIS